MAPSRRAVLGSVALTVGLAGCTGTPGGGQADTEPPTDSATGAESPTPTGSSTPTDTEAGTPAADATVTVGPDGSLVFDPETLAVEVGATVRFRWDSGGHTVTVDSQPDGANWEGTGQSTEGAGFTHTHTFDVAGRYDYYCLPHRGAGMVGSVVVGDGSTATASETTTDTPSGTASPTGTATTTDSPTPTSGTDDGGGGYGGDY